jgi:hypothetical protein
LKLQTQLPGLVQLPKQFKITRRHKRRQYLNDSREEDGNILNEVECENGLESENSPSEHVPNENVQNENISSENAPQLTKKRGRLKTKQATVSDPVDKPIEQKNVAE